MGAKRRLAVVLIVVAVIVARLGARHLHRHPPRALETTPAAAAAPAVPAVGAHQDAWRLGRLTLVPCEISGGNGLASIGAYCTHVEVPENWQAPAGRRIALKVAVVRAQGTPDTDWVTLLDGGPGGAATDDYAAIAAALAPLRERHHILLIDQRGTGGSNPLSCPQLSGQQQSPTQLVRANQPDLLTALLQRCVAELAPRAAPQYYTTTAAVRDLEAVRLALGAPPLDLIGVSYGTRVAQQYARRYPAAVRSVVLDSPVPNTLALGADHARNLERVLRLLFARCRADAACAQHFGDPYATLYRLRAALRSHPQMVQLRDPVSFQPLQLTLSADDLAAVVRFYAYNPLTAALLPLMLDQADHGNYAPLLGQKQWLASDLGDQITSGLELSVVCAEDADLLTSRPQDADTLLGNGMIERARAACRVWPTGSRPADFHAPLVSSRPILILSGELDPVTPPAYAQQILRTLTDARGLIAPGQGHGVIGAGCMPRLVQRFVETLDPSRLDARCLQRLGTAPAFIDYNGAAP
ncbi:MAG TPA: alpha/beta hydrolase [Steroidobacteraceae bacterium]|jgi:pimeloyl-ACP methyl ester carboxylesterase|nr:alpha/beta hydrolase [Steroidobacteraceae bacterium]